MLERLTIQNFAVARDVTLEPAPGLNVFTGETGAGKSLVVDALAFVFGGRRGREVIAGGADRASVLAEVRLDGAAGALALIERSISLTGRTAARINDEPATVERLQELSTKLVEIHGQAEQLAILRPAEQLLALDSYAGLHEQRAAVAAMTRDLRQVRREFETLARDGRERERLLDQLSFELNEITEAAMAPGEDLSLREEQGRLASTGRRREEVEEALEALEGAPLGVVVRAVTSLETRDPEAAPMLEAATTLEANAADLARDLRRYREAIDEDPERLAEVSARLDLIAKLRRKYGETVDEILRYAIETQERLSALEGTGATLEGLQAREAELLGSLAETVNALSAARREAAGGLVHAIAKELAQLGMGAATLSVGFQCDDDAAGPLSAFPDYEVVITQREAGEAHELLPRSFTESGIDRVEFLASFNPGETPRPLSAVASGGETSRFLLALTIVLGAAAPPRLVVLDEVDEGVGGRAGAMVGRALVRLAGRHQVLCVTHLPQVAAFGERHLVVSKQTDGLQTWSEIHPVEGDARLDELASMLGGVTPANREAAKGLMVLES